MQTFWSDNGIDDLFEKAEYVLSCSMLLLLPYKYAYDILQYKRGFPAQYHTIHCYPCMLASIQQTLTCYFPNAVLDGSNTAIQHSTRFLT